MNGHFLMRTCMYKVPNLKETVVSYLNKDKNLFETAADYGAVLVEIEREKEYHGEHTQKFTELKKHAKLLERLSLNLLDESIYKAPEHKRPNLRIVK